MTTNTDLFSGDDKAPKDSSQIKLSPDDALAQLVGEGKPFKSPGHVALGKLEADLFIETLKSENKEMRDALAKASTAEETNKLLKDMMDKLRSASDGGAGDGTNPEIKPLSQEDIVNLVRGEVSQREEARDKLSNRIRANNELLKHFGNDDSKARAFVTMRANELGVTVKGLGTMAETAPQVFLELMGVGKPRITPQHSGGLPLDRGRNPDNRGEEGDGVVRNYSYYKKLRKELGHKYYEPNVQQALIRDRKALGDKFFDK